MMDLLSELPVDICDSQFHAALAVVEPRWVLRGLPWDKPEYLYQSLDQQPSFYHT